MNIRPRARIALTTLFVAAACLITPGIGLATGAGLSPGVLAPGYPSGAPGVNIIAQRGFGSTQNSYAWAASWFEGKLYIGTVRNELCLENETVQYYLNFTGPHPPKIYTPNAAQNVHCAANVYNLDERAEIWQYTPQTDTWRMVFRSPADIPVPGHPGKKISPDVGFRDMTIYTGPNGRPALYVDDVTADEYTPGLYETHPPRILRSYDGIHWTALKTPLLHMQQPNGPQVDMGFRSLTVWKNHMFLLATPDLTGDGAVFEVMRPWSSHPTFRQVTPGNMYVFEIQKFDGNLYVGNGSNTTGYSVYKTNGSGYPYFNWTPVVTGGAGRGTTITSVVSMHVFRNRLYVGASGWNTGKLPDSEMIEIAPNDSWSLVVGNARSVNGKMMYPTSGLNDGFGQIFNAHFWRMATSDGGMYVGTNNYSYVLVNNVPAGENLYADNLIVQPPGFDIWATCDGTDFFAVTRDAFTGNGYDFGARVMIPNGNNLYIGSADQALGTTIFDDYEPSCGSLINNKREPAQPSQLLTQPATHGTLISWVPSTNAVRYEVLRATDEPFTITLSAPPAVPNGFRFDDQPPDLATLDSIDGIPVTSPASATAAAAAAHPGFQTSTASGSAPSQFEPIGTTTNPYFVDPAHGSYEYEVVAEGTSGAASNPSNVQMVPDPRPAATFGLLEGMLGGGTSASAARAGSGPSALLADAQAAWRQGRAGAAYDILERLQTVTSGNPELSQSVYRLERAIQYADIAGGS